MSTHVLAPKKGDATPASPLAATESERPSLKSALGALGFADAEAALKPTEGAPPDDAKVPGDAAKAAPVAVGKDAADATKDPAPVAPAAPAKLTKQQQKQRMEAYTAMRQDGANPAWMKALQRALGVSETGLVSLEVIDALRARQQAKGKERGLGRLDAATLKELVAVVPELGTLDRTLKPEQLTANKSSRGAGTKVPEDEAIHLLGYAKGYPEYVKSLKQGKFLGHSVLLHADMHARLANATAYLQAEVGETDPAKLAEALGVSQVTSFRASEPGSDQMHHATGFAIDVNPNANRWLFGKGETAITYAVRRAAELFGGQAVETGKKMSANAATMDTATLFAELDATNAHFARYRELVRDKAALEAWLESPACPPKAKARGLKYWLDKGAVDEKNLSKNLMTAGGDKSKGASFMDLKQATVTALRDAAGLRWGGADLGSANGDMMHFDGHFMGKAGAIRAKKEAVMKRQKEAGADKPKEDKS